MFARAEAIINILQLAIGRLAGGVLFDSPIS
jgi:hypothetical protein